MWVDLEKTVKPRRKAHQPLKRIREVERELRKSYGM